MCPCAGCLDSLCSLLKGLFHSLCWGGEPTLTPAPRGCREAGREAFWGRGLGQG